MTKGRKDSFVPYAHALRIERAERLVTADSILPTGVPFLDDAMGGLPRNALVLLGAYTGTGKTQLVMHMAHFAAGHGKRVHFFALEAEPGEIQRRMKYQVVRDVAQAKGLGRGMNYVDWSFGRFDAELQAVEAEVSEYLANAYSGLQTYYRRYSDFTPAWFRQVFDRIKDETDLIIVDHLHYFDLDERSTEHQAMKECMKAIRDCSLITGKPVILVAHLRKKDRGSTVALPDLDDFHGTSDITKIVTHAVVMAPGRASEVEQKQGLWPTFMRVAKFRPDMARTRWMAVQRFNSSAQSYESGYDLARWYERLETPEPINFRADLPHWAKNARGANRPIVPPPFEHRRANDD